MSSLYSLMGYCDRPHFEPHFISSAVHSSLLQRYTHLLSSPFPGLLHHSMLYPFSTRGKWLPWWRYFLFQSYIFPRVNKKEGGTSSLQLVSLRKLFRIASFQGRLANAYNPGLSAIVHHNLAIILCLFHLENPYPIKVIQPFQYLLPIKSGRYYLPW